LRGADVDTPRELQRSEPERSSSASAMEMVHF
jgi:hypothetical protein